jgi:Fe-S cluster biogenesis protein NfuA
MATGISEASRSSQRQHQRRLRHHLESVQQAQSQRSPMSNETATSDPQALTIENVERTLDELRPYLMADGGNVEVVEIDGPIVKVRLQGACGSCPSSTMTLKMGIERKLREAIPEVSEVVQVL